jgi:hypothetical protein
VETVKDLLSASVFEGKIKVPVESELEVSNIGYD